jgi:hypothetical protein
VATRGGADPGDKKPDPKQTEADVSAFKDYLAKNHPGKKWQQGPARLDTPELARAYGKRRFYFVFSAPPLPPGAALPELIKRYQERMEEFRKHFMSLTVNVGEKDTIAPLKAPADYNRGLMAVKTDEDAQVAAAAILSLHGSDRVGPGAVSAKEVTVTRSEKGLTCRVTRNNNFAGTVTFDANGRCTAVSKTFIGPLPP